MDYNVEIKSQYQQLSSDETQYLIDNEVADLPPIDEIRQHLPYKRGAQWSHIKNLDEFFERIYKYHQRGGFLAMVIDDWFRFMQYLFIISFCIFLMNCVNYDVLFYEAFLPNFTGKVEISDGIYTAQQCFERFNLFTIFLLVVSSCLLLFEAFRNLRNMYFYADMREFFNQVLDIPSDNIGSYSWHEIQTKLKDVQREIHLCIQKANLTELDIYNRILRFKNYEIAMINKEIINVKFRFPILGECVIFTNLIKYNLELLLYYCPFSSPFKTFGDLKTDYREAEKREELISKLSNYILILGLLNLILSPLIFFFILLYTFFRYAALCRRDPTILGSRMWSLYARLYLRHFNELDHEFAGRLNRAYKCSARYLDSFTMPVTVAIAQFVSFFSGSILMVLGVLIVIDSDILNVNHVISSMTFLGIIFSVSRSCIPDDNAVHIPKLLMLNILKYIHYMPEDWADNAHRFSVREQFSHLFQYKFSYLIGELLSPLTAPFFILFSLRKKALNIVDFYRNFTINVSDVGDVCSFAQMDIKRHEDPKYVGSDTEANNYYKVANGKTALSLIHFKFTNPDWKPPEEESKFLNSLRNNLIKENPFGMPQTADAMFSSLRSIDVFPPIADPIIKENVIGAQNIECPMAHSGTMQTNFNQNDLTEEMNQSTLFLHNMYRQNTHKMASQMEFSFTDSRRSLNDEQ